MFKITIVCISLLWSIVSWSEVVSIPLQYTGQPATDLVDSAGNSLTVIESDRIWKKQKDLSELNPAPSDIWQSGKVPKLHKSDDDFNTLKDESFKYVDKVISAIGSFRFIARESGAKSLNRDFNIWVSKDARSILLRKNLLRKMGYRVPRVQHKQRIKIKFKGMASLNAFVEELETATFADSKRWVVAKHEVGYELILQDVLILEANTKIYNLAMGDITEDYILKQRVLNALSIPFALADLRESVDGFSWSLGKVDNKVALVDIISGEAFTTTFYDAVWAIKQLSKLKAHDFEEIVRLAYFPDSVGQLLTQKLISRFNSLQRMFMPNAKARDVEFEISSDNSKELVRGRLTQNTW